MEKSENEEVRFEWGIRSKMYGYSGDWDKDGASVKILGRWDDNWDEQTALEMLEEYIACYPPDAPGKIVKRRITEWEEIDE